MKSESKRWERRFAPSLLDQPTRSRLKYFKDYRVSHRLQKEARDEIANAIREPGGRTVLLVTGPTGVGKSTLGEIVRDLINREIATILRKDPGRAAAFMVEAVAPERGNFHFGDFYRRTLIELDEPLIEYKATPEARIFNAVRRATTTSRPLVPDLRYALEQACRHRKPPAFLVDEAQSMMKTGSEKTLQDHLECLKSLANMAGTVIVLLGTYKLLDFTLNDQLSRRCRPIHIPRYRIDQVGDAETFIGVLKSFELAMPLQEQPDLASQWDYYYDRSVGCIGILKDWLTLALKLALDEGAEALNQAHVQKTALAVDDLLRIAKVATDGEKEWARRQETPQSLANLRVYLGYSEALLKDQIKTDGESTPPAPPIGHSKRIPIRSRARPFRRKPNRDPLPHLCREVS
jgi:rRNA-processing protein FCF1